MEYKEVLGKIAELVGFEFKSQETQVEVKFERVALEGGEIFVTNQAESDFAIGDTIYVETAEGYEVAPAGSHILEDGREIVLDEESKLVEIREEGDDDDTEEEVIVESPDEEVEVETSVDISEVTELKTAIHDLLMAFEKQASELNDRFSTLEADYTEFKKSAEYKPLREETKLKQNFADMRLDILKQMKNK
jgi:hypothetical protein